MNRRERRAAARQSQKASNGTKANTLAALYETGLHHMREGQYLDAQVCCKQMLAQDPEHADALHLMGLLSLQAKQYDHALEWITRAIGENPKAEFLSTLGTTLQRQGRLEEALRAFEKAVQLEPDNTELRRQLSSLFLELGRLNEALPGYQQILARNPRDWDAACKSGFVFYRLGRLEEALNSFNRCDELQPNHAATLFMRAVFLCGLSRFEEALADWRRAHALDPDNADTCSNVGSLLQLSGHYEEALSWHDRAIALRPNFAEALYKRAVCLGKLSRTSEALTVVTQLHGLDAGNTVSDWNLAHLLYELDRPEQALIHLDRHDERQPNQVQTLCLRALCLHKQGQYEESLAENRRAHALDPTNADICNNIGEALRLLERYEEALPWFERAVALRPNFVEALINKAFLLRQTHRFAESFDTYDRVRIIDPDNVLAEWNLANLHLLSGNFEAGWVAREARWKLPSHGKSYPKFSQPKWLGAESIDGKTILIQVDEGLGDTIQFARYVPMVAALGARVILVVDKSLHPLLSDLPGVSQCLPLSAHPLPPFDMHCPITSLPLAFGTRLDTIPAAMPYLPAPAAARVQTWEQRLGPHNGLRVGLVWSGNPKQKDGHHRSVSLDVLTRILEVDATFVSLQKDPRPADKAVLERRTDILDLTAHLTDFRETAALVNCLDLVITIDTSVAHLAGALGRPTWVLLSYASDFRWLLDRDDSPWYPTVRLFRQSQARDFGEVLDRVRSELRSLVSAR